jgi:hypothetical protein
LTVAVIVIVTLPPAGTAPFQVTVLVPIVATAVPLVAFALTSVRPAGRTSVNSSPGLSPEAEEPEFEIVIVYVTVPPAANVPLAVFVAEINAAPTVKTVGSLEPPTPGSSVCTVVSFVASRFAS